MNAWEVTVEDVQCAINCSEELADEIHDELDMDEIESSALYGVEIEEQAELASNEIRSQVKHLIEAGIISTTENLTLSE